jgi:peptidoglycan/xylan/chitin deacetylase (PgdA/CDA1 family)
MLQKMLLVCTSEQFQPEKEYILHVLLGEMLGIAYRVEYKPGDRHVLQLPNGSELIIKDGFPDLHRMGLEGWQMPAEGDWNPSTFDPFATAFYLLTRSEERQIMTRDKHGRFPVAQSLAWKHGFLQRPVVNEWADRIWDALLRLGWKGERKSRQFRMSISCDVDHPRLWWSEFDRLKTLAGAVFKRGDLQEAGYWFKNHMFRQKDPYDVFDEWMDLFEKNGHKAQFNFMGQRPASSDCWYPLNHSFIKNLITKMTARGHTIGFHPSYEAFEDQEAFKRELASLQDISPVEIVAGRQHYLRFSVPETWKMWEGSGLKEDSTLGYPEQVGFRAGICHDYPVFDLETRKMLRLREKPLIAMDVTLAQYQQLTPQQALESLLQLRKTVEKHQGDYTLLWHNSSWNSPFWENWKAVFRSMV